MPNLHDKPQPGSTDRPRITLAWAQSLDGSIARESGAPTVLSGPESHRMTHALRASHDAILVGIGTILADDPLLSVRLVEGPDPQPIILDSALRTPAGCRVMQRTDKKPWIFCTPPPMEARPEEQALFLDRQQTLESRGARIFPVARNTAGQVDLPGLTAILSQAGIASLMVEGGAAVLASFLLARLVDRVNLTIAPRFLSGLNPLALCAPGSGPRLVQTSVTLLGKDMVIDGVPVWDAPGT